MIALAMTIVYSVAVLLVGVLIKRRRAKDKTIRNFLVEWKHASLCCYGHAFRRFDSRFHHNGNGWYWL